METSKLTFKDVINTAKIKIHKKGVSRIRFKKFFNKTQQQGEALQAFRAALTAEAARSEFGAMEDELVKDLFMTH